mmetsp:Transcript_26452/g.83842  ORF Transcript_26452/g.83842 Transcript_26452/m.83842 type:complete len:269 (-) Transcript_26452:89-895(-)
MDPEAGALSPTPGDRRQGPEDGGPPGVMQLVLQALWERLQAVLGVLAPKQRNVGVENRFYFDETEKVWKLQGGETEQERAESEAIRFHTSRGLSASLAPPTTACDASRADWAVQQPPPPPPTSGPVTRSLHGATGGPGLEALAHPVYAPAASFAGDVAAAAAKAPGPPPVRALQPPALAKAKQPGPLASPFAAGLQHVPSPTPLPSPVPAPPSGAAGPAGVMAPTPLASPFGVAAAAPAAAQALAPTPLASPFGSLQQAEVAAQEPAS